MDTTEEDAHRLTAEEQAVDALLVPWDDKDMGAAAEAVAQRDLARQQEREAVAVLALRVTHILLAHCMLSERYGWRVSGRETLLHLRLLMERVDASEDTFRQVRRNVMLGTLQRVLFALHDQRVTPSSQQISTLRVNLAGFIEALEEVR